MVEITELETKEKPPLTINATVLVPQEQIIRIDEKEHNFYLITPIGIFVIPKVIKTKTGFKIPRRGTIFNINWDGIEANKEALKKDLFERFFIDTTEAWYEAKAKEEVSEREKETLEKVS
jgi:hypothetical protein